MKASIIKAIELLKMKPTESILSLTNKLTEAYQPQHYSKNQCVRMNIQRECLILIKGKVNLIDSHGDSICTISAPLILGIPGCFGYFTELQFRICGAAVISRISTLEIDNFLTKENMWRHAAHIISFNYIFILMMNNELRNLHQPVKKRVISSILLLDDCQKLTMDKIFLAKFIISSTSLSRSAVMKSIHHLKENGMIYVDQGVLIKINKEALHKEL